MKTKRYYAAQFWSGLKTTIGEPNPLTGRMSIACDLAVFSEKSKRDEWVSNGKLTSDMRGNCRMSVSKKDARKLTAGWSLQDFNEYIESMIDATERDWH